MEPPPPTLQHQAPSLTGYHIREKVKSQAVKLRELSGASRRQKPAHSDDRNLRFDTENDFRGMSNSTESGPSKRVSPRHQGLGAEAWDAATLKFGDEVMLCIDHSSSEVRHVGMLVAGSTSFACLPDAGFASPSFMRSIFVVQSPDGTSVGPVQFGDPIVLVCSVTKEVWCSKPDAACLSFRSRGYGEVHVAFRNTLEAGGEREVHFLDSVYLESISTNRIRTKFDGKILTSQTNKKLTSCKTLSCDGHGEPVSIQLQRSVRIDLVQIEMPHANDSAGRSPTRQIFDVSWGSPLPIFSLHWDALLVVKLSNELQYHIPAAVLTSGASDGMFEATVDSDWILCMRWTGTRALALAVEDLAAFVSLSVVLLWIVMTFIRIWLAEKPLTLLHLIVVALYSVFLHLWSRNPCIGHLHNHRSIYEQQYTVTMESLKPRANALSAGRRTSLVEIELPLRYLRVESGNAVRARERWSKVQAWRRENALDQMLFRPHQFFDLIKAHSSSFFCGNARDGSTVCYEHLGAVDLDTLYANGITMEDLIYHSRFRAEFLWNHLCPDEDDQAILIVDLNGLTMSDARGDKMTFLKNVIKEGSTYYPDRTRLIFILNAPSWFNLTWGLVKSVLPQRTLNKIRICGAEYQDQLKSVIAADQIPQMHGGVCPWAPNEAPDEVAFINKARALNSNKQD